MENGQGRIVVFASENRVENVATVLKWDDIDRIAQLAANKTYRMAFEQNIGHEAFRIPNNIIGRVVLWVLRFFLNKRVYRLVPRGRTPRRKMAWRFIRDVPRDNARFLAVYLYTKRGHER